MIVVCGIRATSICVLVVAASVAVGAWAPSSARAQSAEENVAFFMWGLEKSSRVGVIGAHRWAVVHNDGRISTFEIRRVSECRYHASLQKQLADGSATMVDFDYSLDFSVVTEYDAWIANDRGDAIIIKIEGTSWYSKRVVNPANGRLLQDIKGGGVDASVAAGGSVERLRNAFVAFRTSHCKRGGS